jgi:hypothetical protein
MVRDDEGGEIAIEGLRGLFQLHSIFEEMGGMAPTSSHVRDWGSGWAGIECGGHSRCDLRRPKKGGSSIGGYGRCTKHTAADPFLLSCGLR